MKLTIEEQDIKDVKTVLSDYFGIIINDEQAKCLIEKNSDLAVEIYKYGCFDTVIRSRIVNTLVKRITKGYEKTLHFLLNGDSDEYKAEFDEVFKEAAKRANIELDTCWHEKNENVNTL